MGKGYKVFVKEVLEFLRGCDWKFKISVGLFGFGGDKKKDNF